MADNKNKLENFKKAVFADIESKVDDKIREAKETADKMREDTKSAVAYNEQEQLQKIDKDIQSRIVRETSSKQLDSRRNILIHRMQLVDKVFENVTKKLAEFRSSDKYEEHLLTSLKECMAQLPDQKGIVYIGKDDEKYKGALEKVCGYNVKLRTDILLGGLMVSYPDKNIMLDRTFDSALEQEREDFCNVSDLAL